MPPGSNVSYQIPYRLALEFGGTNIHTTQDHFRKTGLLSFTFRPTIDP